MSDITPSKWSAWSAAAGATPVDFGTRPCGICGERVRVTLSGAWCEYHDCKPVPLARLQQAERERDEARAEVVRLYEDCECFSYLWSHADIYKMQQELLRMKTTKDHEREAMARVCEAAKGLLNLAGVEDVDAVCAQFERMQLALADLERARKGKG